MWTANGAVESGDRNSLRCGAAKKQIEAIVLDKTPCVLSMGRRCLKEGFGFHWDPYKRPYLRTFAGERIELHVSHEIPLLPEGFVCTAKQSQGDELTIGNGDREELARGGESSVAGSPDPDGHLLTHLPKRDDCDTCQIAKAQKKSCRRRKNVDPDLEPKAFGECLTVDHIVTVNDEIISVDGHSNAVVVRDRATGWIEACPTAQKSSDEADQALQQVISPKESFGIIRSDGSGELETAIQQLGWKHSTATPGMPNTNGVAERVLRTVLEGTRSLLHQSGLDRRWWSRCLMHNATWSGQGSETPWLKRHGQDFPADLHPFDFQSVLYAGHDQG